MRIKVTQTAIVNVVDSNYRDWLEEAEDGRDWDSMTYTQRLEVIKECEEEVGYEIVNELEGSNKVEIELA